MTTIVSGSQITFNDNTTQNTSAYGGGFAFRNKLINGNFDIAQRGTSFTSTSSANNDDTYNLDRWYVLSDGNDIVDITQTTTVPTTGPKYSIGLDVETVNKKFGIAQIIEHANCYDAIGGNVTLSFQAKVSATTKLDNVKCAVVAWSGTADTVTSDIISAWNVEGTNPTLIANATYENTPANLNVTTSWATYSVTANVDTASTTNIIVFIWSDVTDTTLGDFLYVTNVQLEKGSTATSFDYRPYSAELAMCQRYYYKWLNDSGGFVYPFSLQSYSASAAYGKFFDLPVTMRATPTCSASGTFEGMSSSGSAGTAFTGLSINSPTKNTLSTNDFTGSSGMSAGQCQPTRVSNNAFIQASAEL